MCACSRKMLNCIGGYGCLNASTLNILSLCFGVSKCWCCYSGVFWTRYPSCDSFFFSCILLLSALNANNRMMMRAFGHNPCCDNQSCNVFLRGEIKLTLPHFLIPVSSLHVCCILYSGKHMCHISLFFYVVSLIQMIQSRLEEHSHAMMLKHSITKHLLPPLNTQTLELCYFSGED